MKYSFLGFFQKTKPQPSSNKTYWADKSCGILCLKEIIKIFNNQNIKTTDLIDKGLKSKAYNENLGWKHDGLIKIAKKHGIRGKKNRGINIDKISQILDQGRLIIASVSLNYLQNVLNDKKSGHLILIKSIERNDNKDRLINIFDPNEKEPNIKISPEKFFSNFSGNIIQFTINPAQ